VPIEGSISPTEAKLRFGARSVGEANFHGHMEEVRIWNTARTTEQIQRNMYTRMIGDEEGSGR
jgi:Concanavalin A-like lectin/glucanases superfamily